MTSLSDHPKSLILVILEENLWLLIALSVGLSPVLSVERASRATILIVCFYDDHIKNSKVMLSVEINRL